MKPILVNDRFCLQWKFLVMQPRPMSLWKTVLRNWPVTIAVIAVAVAVHVGVSAYPWINPSDGSEARRRFGAYGHLMIYREAATDESLKPIPQLVGPFDLWGGQLWRVMVNGFHHANILHLGMNCMAIGFMGWLLEPRMGWFRYAIFMVTATTVSGVPECLLLNNSIGLSGGAYALFGCLLVLREKDREIADLLPQSFVTLGFVWLFLCMVLTVLDILAIANAAHVTGLIYGWLAGQVFYGRLARRQILRMGFFASHLLLIPAFYFIMHPVWLGTYHWYQAVGEGDPQRRAAHYEQAIARDPALEIPWRILAMHYADSGEPLRGWNTMLRGLDYNRSDQRGVETARKIWRSLRSADQRWQALLTLKKFFGEESAEWQKRLAGESGRGKSSELPLAMDMGLPMSGRDKPQSDAERAFRQLFSGELPRPDGNPDLSAPAIDPEAVGSAAEGVTL